MILVSVYVVPMCMSKERLWKDTVLKLLNDLNNIMFSLLLMEKESLINFYAEDTLGNMQAFIYFAILHGSLTLGFLQILL